MSDSKRNGQSIALKEFVQSYLKAETKDEKDDLWASITTPFIEKIVEDEKNCLVTFLYREPSISSLPYVAIYLDSSVIGMPFSKNGQLKHIPQTDIFYLTLRLPSTLRTAYTFLKLDKTEFDSKQENHLSSYPFPEFTAKIKGIINTLMRLHAEKKYDLDQRNPKTMSYTEYENSDNCFFTESILELPDAPVQEDYLSDLALINKERRLLAEKKRFYEDKILFAETSLKDRADYKAHPEDKDSPPKGQRKYWIYLPPEYEEKAEIAYPLCLFLDGSEYLNTIPMLSILERMIKNKEIPPCIAIFFEYSSTNRMLEYYGDESFTHFLADDLIKIVRKKHRLSVTDNPHEITIFGFSASGLAAIHAGLTRPDIFGNVIAYSAALWSKKQADLYRLVDNYLSKKSGGYFCMEVGSYENVALECQFEDGYVQAVSILEANKDLAAYMRQKGVNVNFYEFIGGHNCICYKSTLPNRLKELFDLRLSKVLTFDNSSLTKRSD